VIKPHLSPKVISSTTFLAHLPSYLKEVTPLAQAQAIKRMNMVMIPLIVRVKSLMMQGPTAPLDDHHQGTILKHLLITLIFSFNHPSGSSHIGKIPQFDGTGYSKWKNSMEEYLMAVNPALWTIVNRGITFPSGDATLTQEQANEIQMNYQAIRIIKSSLTFKEYDKVDRLKSAKEVWDTLFVNHEGTKQVREGRI
jgi:hypothetical protein